MLRSLRFQLTFVFGALVLVVASALSWWLGTMLTGELAAERGRALEIVAANTASLLADGLDERAHEVALLARSRDVRALVSGAPVAGDLERVQADRPYAAWVTVTDAGGMVRWSTREILAGQDASSRAWFLAARGGLYVGDVRASTVATRASRGSKSAEPLHLIDFAAPLAGDDGARAGTVLLQVDWRWAADVVGRVRRDVIRDAGVQIYILDRRGDVIHRPSGGADGASAPGDAAALASPRVVAWPDGGRHLTVGVPLRARTPITDLGWTIVVRQPETLALAAAGRAEALVRAFVAASLVLSMLAAWRIAGRFARPLHAIAAAARRIGAGERDVALPVSTQSDELRTLSSSLAAMLRGLHDRERALRAAKDDLERRVAERTVELQIANAKLERLAHEDVLTGLPNRRAADALLRRELALHGRHGRALGVLLIDIDRFKRVNDVHGHATGDAVLRAVAQRLPRAVRASDVAARFGGEEFLVVLRETGADGVRPAAEKVRAAVAAAAIEPAGTVTVSVGAAVARADDTVATLLQRADEALYAAKEAGRNRVVVAGVAAASQAAVEAVALA